MPSPLYFFILLDVSNIKFIDVIMAAYICIPSPFLKHTEESHLCYTKYLSLALGFTVRCLKTCRTILCLLIYGKLHILIHFN